MKYSIDCEFIDTPDCSALISIAVVRDDYTFRYFEFDFPRDQLTDWLNKNVVPHLDGTKTTFAEAAKSIKEFVGDDARPEFWCYYGAYDWYWFCRLFGGFISMPPHWPHRFRELADYHQGIPNNHGPEHNALADALSQLDVMLAHRLVP